MPEEQENGNVKNKMEFTLEDVSNILKSFETFKNSINDIKIITPLIQNGDFVFALFKNAGVSQIVGSLFIRIN